jgi:hypothetical protein
MNIVILDDNTLQCEFVYFSKSYAVNYANKKPAGPH